MAGEVISTDKERDEIISYLQEELSISFTERERMSKKWEIWRRHAEARPEEDVKNDPWPKASNIAVPLTQTKHAGIYATMKAKYGNTKPLLTVSTDDEKRKKQAEYVTEWLNFLIESKFHLNLREVNNTLFYDLSLLGTQFVRIPWLKDMHSFKRRNAKGNLEQVNVQRHNGAAVIPVRIEDFFTRLYNYDIQRAPWVATRSYLMWHELKQREAQGIYENVDKIKDQFARVDDNTEESFRRQGISARKEMKDVYEIYQCNLFWDIDGDGIPEDIVIFFEKESGIILREELNELGFRDLVRIPYIPRPNQLYGMGVGWLCEYMQQEVDMLHNSRNDGTLLSTFQMFVTRRGSGIPEHEEFFPGKQFVVDDPRNDFVPIRFPDLGQTSMQAEALANQYAENATGATNALMGQPDQYAKSRATASGTMFLAQQSSRLFNAISENLEAGLGEIGLFVVLQNIAHAKTEEIDLSMLSEEKQPFVREVLNMKIEDIHLKFNFKITSTDLDETEEAKRQQLLTLTQLYTMYGQQMLGLVSSNIQIMMQVDPEAAQRSIKQYEQFSSQLIIGGTNLMGKILTFFDVEHKDYLLYVRDIEIMREMMIQFKDQQLMGVMGGQGGLQGNSQRPAIPQGVPRQGPGGPPGGPAGSPKQG